MSPLKPSLRTNELNVTHAGEVASAALSADMLVPPVAAVTLAVANARGAFHAQKSAQMIASRQRHNAQNPPADLPGILPDASWRPRSISLKTDDMMRVWLASNG